MLRAKITELTEKIAKLTKNSSNSLKALTAWMKDCGHLSFTTLRRFISAMFHIDVSTGYLAKIVYKVSDSSDSMKLPYDELSTAIQNEEHVHPDETVSKENENHKAANYGKRIVRKIQEMFSTIH